jgi:hypothetical protein
VKAVIDQLVGNLDQSIGVEKKRRAFRHLDEPGAAGDMRYGAERRTGRDVHELRLMARDGQDRRRMARGADVEVVVRWRGDHADDGDQGADLEVLHLVVGAFEGFVG